jgi:Helix-turn-helix domain
MSYGRLCTLIPVNVVQTRDGSSFLTIKSAADELGVAVTSLQDWCRECRFPHIKYDGKRLIRIPVDWFQAYASGELTEGELVTRRIGIDGRIVGPPKGRRR